ncbi:regulator of G-protein signaling protein-like [Oenanthe melanoleuca]|uniref:regulator of G-protein signaling protein-like n=1 Tax=Oenanthe melanoleuca TaxID=2939378 RepID=UPI0024C1A06C|nr:regulator of G-protein signaling protein-like [Oenanthe melanoleuca]
MTAASIASTDMRLLLQDDVFADFFNTFLNLPVFGQTPLYISGMGQWYLWPELPRFLDPSPAALLAWLEKHRLPHFCKSSLCLHLVLCQKLLGFIRSGEAAELLNWQSADQWLLERCISGSHGMRHFCAFIRGTAGEELIDFWLITERLLGLDESDGSQRDLFLSLIHRLRATHLREGSSVVTLCTTIAGSLPKARHIQSISTRRDILSKMQEQALFIIQSYWLPKFFVHCKTGVEEEESCQPLLQEYQERLSRASWQEPPGLSEPLPRMHIQRSQGVSGPYCSWRAKAEVWAQPSAEQDLENLCKEKILSDRLPSASLGRLRSLKKRVKTLDFLPWALSADACAGRPFREFLQRRNRPMETHLLDLWHDLEEFLPVVLDSNRENSFFLRHLIGEKICKTYLEEGSIEKLPVETRTLVSLWNHLICGEFSPWIFRAQMEICKVLCSVYEEFLADDDRTFLQFMAPGIDVSILEMLGYAAGRGQYFHLFQRMNQSLKLSQALLSTSSLEGVSSKLWQLLAVRDLQKGGSIQAELELLLGSAELQRMMAGELAVDSPGKEEELLQLMNAALAVASERIARENAAAAARKRASRKRSFEEDDEEEGPPKKKQKKAEKQTQQQEDLLLWSKKSKSRRRQHGQEGREGKETQAQRMVRKEPVCWQAEGICQARKRGGAVRQGMSHKWSEGVTPGELQEGSRERLPPTGSGVLLHTDSTTSETEKYWVPNPTAKAAPALRVGSDSRAEPQCCSSLADASCAVFLQEWAWDAIRELVRSFCKFRREMKNQKCRAEFEEFLRQERINERENLPVKEKKKSPAKSPAKGKAQQEKVTLVKRRILDKQLIVVNFLVNDLRFYLEMDKFSKLAECKDAVAPRNAPSEKKVAFLRKKHDMISKLFLDSDIPPKLRVNISEKERDSICRLPSKKPLTRAVYHSAKVTLFPILMYFWRRFCIWKVMRSYQKTREDKSFGLTKGDKKSRLQKGERSSQEPKRGKGHKEGKVSASSRPEKTPSKAPEILDLTTVLAIVLAERYAPGKRPVLTFKLSEGVELLEPWSRRKSKPSEELKDLDPSEEKRPSVSEPAPQDGDPREKRPSLSEPAPQDGDPREKRPSLSKPAPHGDPREKRPSLSEPAPQDGDPREKRPSLSEPAPQDGDPREKRPSLSKPAPQDGDPREKRPSLSKPAPQDGERVPQELKEAQPSP